MYPPSYWIRFAATAGSPLRVTVSCVRYSSSQEKRASTMTKDPAMLSIFVGSSSEKKKIAEYLQDVLQELDSFVKINPWWQTSVFQTGDTHIESLCSAVETTNAAILIFGEDDRTDRRGEASWTTRDNIVLEYGMFAAAHGRNNVMIARVGNPTMPADLAGINCVLLEEADD